MKALKMNAALAGLALTACIACVSLPSNAQYSNLSVSERVQKENSDVNRDLASIGYQKRHIALLKDQYKQDRKAGNEEAALVDKEALCKSSADLQRSKSYLATDKRSLIAAHGLAISNYKKAMKDDRKDLAAAKKKLHKADSKAERESAQLAVNRNKSEYDRHKAGLQRAKVNRSENILAVNRQIKKENGEFIGLLYTENSMAYVDKAINK